jgi:hypothetical protein
VANYIRCAEAFMHECDRDDQARRATSECEHDFVADAANDDTWFRARDHGSAIRMAGLVVLLVGIFAGMAWFLEASLRVPAHGAPAVLAVIGAAPAGDEERGWSGKQASTSGAAEPGICAMSYPAPEHVAKFLSPGRQETPPPPGASGTIDVRLRHELSFGRLIVALDDRTVLSKPFTVPGDGPATVAHQLSVPSGRHAVRVEILGTEGELFAGGTIIARIDPDRTARLDVEHAAGTPHTIKLKLSTDDEAGTRASY